LFIVINCKRFKHINIFFFELSKYHIAGYGGFIDITSEITGDLKKDIALLRKIFIEAREGAAKAPEQTLGDVKYTPATLVFIDGTDKLWDFSKASLEDKKEMCELISDSNKKYSAILLTTFDNFASNQFHWGDSFFHKHLEDLTANIPLERVTETTLPKVVNYCIKKHQLPFKDPPDLSSLLERPEFKTALTIDDVENHLTKMVLDSLNNS